MEIEEYQNTTLLSKPQQKFKLSVAFDMMFLDGVIIETFSRSLNFTALEDIYIIYKTNNDCVGIRLQADRTMTAGERLEVYAAAICEAYLIYNEQN